MTDVLRVATVSDIPSILEIIIGAKAFLKEQGIDQWQNGYPDLKQIQSDIETKNAYVFVIDNSVLGYAFLNIGIDEAYEKITDGQWDNKYSNYAAIHRLAITSNYRSQGLAKIFIEAIIKELFAKGIKDIRIDTHFDNKIVQHLAEKFGFVYRGIVMYEGKRKAYQLVI